MRTLLLKLAELHLGVFAKIYKRLNRDFNARKWSNRELQRVAAFFKGNVLNVSAGADSDKENGFYRDYFSSADKYFVSNYYKTKSGIENEVILDLEDKITNTDLINRFDVVFTHTVLEHVYDMDMAIDNLCKFSKDVIITVVPFMQTFHHQSDKYSDYWRFSPHSLIKKFKAKGYQTIYLSWNDIALGNIYIFHICSKYPENYKDISNIDTLNVDIEAPGASSVKLYSNYKNNRNILLGNVFD